VVPVERPRGSVLGSQDCADVIPDWLAGEMRRLGYDPTVTTTDPITPEGSGILAAQAVISCWDTKRVYDSSRPWTLIRHYYAGKTVRGWAVHRD
jgi:hypothetical protein